MFQRAKYAPDSEKDWKNIPNPVATLKYDGGHDFVTVEDDGKLRFFSRRQSVKGHYPEHTEKLPHITSKKLPQFAGNTYSVELIHTGQNKDAKESHPKLSGLLNSLAPRALQIQKEEGPIRAVLIDVINPPLATYKDKLLHMKGVEKAFGSPDLLFAPEPHITTESIVKLINKTKNEGREGVIITSLTEPEQRNTRVKIKHQDFYNLKVKSIVQEIDIHGKPKPSMGALVLEDASGREVGKVGTGFLREDRVDAWTNPGKWVGQLVQVKSRGLVREGGLLKEPVYNGFSDSGVDTVRFK